MHSILQALWFLVQEVWEIAGAGVEFTQVITRVNSHGLSDRQIYLAGLRRLAILVIVLPIPLLGASIWLGGSWAASAGMIWAVAFLLLSLVAAPIGMIVAALGSTTRESGEKYVRVVLSVVFSELLVAFFLAVVPIRNNISALPLLALCAFIIILAGMKFLRKGLVIAAVAAFALLVFSFFFPRTFEQKIAPSFERLDTQMAAAPPVATSAPAQQPVTAALPSPARIYPNYKFDLVDRIEVPLLPAGQVLPHEAGGWVILPMGARYRVDYDTPVVIEYNDGRRFIRRPNEPAFDGVQPGNGIFRLYGENGQKAVVTIRKD